MAQAARTSGFSLPISRSSTVRGDGRDLRQAVMGEGVDESGIDELPRGVDDLGPGRRLEVLAHGLDLAVLDEQAAVRDRRSGDGDDRRVLDEIDGLGFLADEDGRPGPDSVNPR